MVSRSTSLLAGLACLAACAAAPPRWQPLGEPGCGGWLTSLSVCPTNPRRVLVGGDMLGVGRSEDRGDSWQPTFGFRSYEIGDFTWHPTEPDTVWVGTMSGPYVSRDGGTTWSERRAGMPPPAEHEYTAPIEKILFDPTDPRRLLALGGSSRGWHSPGRPRWGWLWESRDGGETWRHLTTLTKDGAVVGEDSRGGNLVSGGWSAGPRPTLYVASRGVGLFASPDGGTTWERRDTGLPGGEIERVICHPTEPTVLWVCLNHYRTADGWQPGGIWKSRDAGRTWREASAGLSRARNPQQQFFTASYKALALSPTNPNRLVTCDGAWNTGVVYLTDDGGESWRPVATKQNIGQDEENPERRRLLAAARVETAYFAGAGLTVAAFDPTTADVIFGAGSEYILRTLDGGRTWTDATAEKVGAGWRGRGYSGLCSVDAAFDPRTPGRLFIAAMDAGKLWETTDGGRSWVYRGHQPWPWGGGRQISFAGDRAVYATTGQFGGNGSVLRTLDGVTWETLTGPANGLPRFESAEARGIYAQRDDPRRVWAVFGRQLFATADGGQSWRVVLEDKELGWLAGDPREPRRFYVSGATSVWRTEDGVKFEAIGGPKTPGRVACDREGRLYVCAWRTNRAGLWRYDGQWTRLRDDYYLYNVAPDPTDPRRLVVVHHDHPYKDLVKARGVWLSVDGGASWAPANEGLPNLRLEAVAFNPHDPTELVVGTHGSGYFTARWAREYAPAGVESYQSTAADRDFAAPPPVVLARSPVLKNSAMTDGEGVPAGWEGKFGEVTVARDTTVFHSPPASLRVEGAAGKSGQAFQSFELAGARTLRFSGVARCAGQARVNVALQAFDAGWTRNEFKQVQYLQGDTDWLKFERQVELPDWTARFNVLLLVEGDGRAWLDDVALVQVAE